MGSIWATPGHAHCNGTANPAADPAASASVRAEVILSTTEKPAADQEPDADEGGSKADEPADDGTPPEVQAILRQRQHEAQTRRMWEQWLAQRLERQPWLLGATEPSPGAVDAGCVQQCMLPGTPFRCGACLQKQVCQPSLAGVTGQRAFAFVGASVERW